MLKQIDVRELREGMFLKELCGSWIDSPLWRKSVLLASQEDIRRIVDSGIRHAWIDTAKGLDIAVDTPPSLPEGTADLAFNSLSSTILRVPAEVEKARAAEICASAKEAIRVMFESVRMGRAVHASDALPLVEEISNSILRNNDALIGLVRIKTGDDYTYMHSVAVCALMIALGRQLGLDENQVRQAGMAGLLHDIGKIAIPAHILNKPGALTVEEFETVKSHPAAGYKMLSGGTGIEADVLDVCLHHHEKIDGSGYPDGLAGDAISLFARMGAVCDVYDAITSDRPYKRGWCPAVAVRKMAQWHGHFDPTVFTAFVKRIGVYPVGALVRLKSGRLAVVIEQTEKSLLTPRVKVLFSTKSMTYIPPETLNLNRPGLRDEIVGIEDPDKWRLKHANVMRG
jgi:putative nucleotidyltransferase with HDIG domain